MLTNNKNQIKNSKESNMLRRLQNGHHCPRRSLKKKTIESREIVSQRPFLWIHIGPRLLNATDPSVPKIHYNELVNPFDPYIAPPRL